MRSQSAAPRIYKTLAVHRYVLDIETNSGSKPRTIELTTLQKFSAHSEDGALALAFFFVVFLHLFVILSQWRPSSGAVVCLRFLIRMDPQTEQKQNKNVRTLRTRESCRI